MASKPKAKANDPSKPLLSSRHEAFAVHYAANDNAAEAWRHSGGTGPWANRQGDKWTEKRDIIDRVAWLRAEAERALAKKVDKQNRAAVLTVAEKREISAKIARGEIVNQGPDGPSVKCSDMLAAMKLDNDLAGDGAEAETAAGILALIRRRRHD